MPGVSPKIGRIDPRSVKGWAIDADSENDPTYPMNVRQEGERARGHWERPGQQPMNVEVLHSNERPNLSAVFGEAAPPKAISGMIRRWAFHYSESSYGHWLPLMFADRINMVEGFVEDLTRGQVPNIPSELGWNAEWQHNRTNLIARIAVSTLVATVTVGILAAFLKRRTS